MTKRPPTIAEAKAALLKTDAVAYARDFVRMIKTEKVEFCGLPLSWLEKPDSQRLAREWLKRLAGVPNGLLDLTNYARAGVRLADEALRELIIEFQHHGRPMPPPLQTYNMEITDHRRARPHWKPARKTPDNFVRDIAITAMVGDVCMKFGLRPTRQLQSKPIGNERRLSGCRVVALALAEEGYAMISEAAVVAVWTRYGRNAFPNLAARPVIN